MHEEVDEATLQLMGQEHDAGGGMVRVVASGDLRVLEVHVEPTLVDAKDREMIEDLTATAISDAIAKAV